VHGKNARITNNGLTASRPRALGEFNEAIVIANRALRDGEMFEVVIDKMVSRWSGAIEAGDYCLLSEMLCLIAIDYYIYTHIICHLLNIMKFFTIL
jgi:hypothetical protein